MIYNKNEEHLGHPVLREAKAIELARVPVNGDRLQDSVILHPRYVPQGVEHEIFIARAYRRGRTIDLFLDEPITVDGVEYGILNFKGAGSNAVSDDNARDVQELVIHPDKWYCGWRAVKWQKRDDPYDRVWGALTKEAAEKEYPAKIFHDYGIRHAPHVAVNEIPNEITERMREVHQGNEKHHLVQLVRALRTNIRVDDFIKRGATKYHGNVEQRLEDVTDIDGAYIKAQINLAKKQKMIWFIGDIEENRFIDGLFTDAENFSIRDLDLLFRDLDLFEAACFVRGLIISSIDAVIYDIPYQEYYMRLEAKTKIPFTQWDSELFTSFVMEQMKLKIEEK